jgi:hypothetical protein
VVERRDEHINKRRFAVASQGDALQIDMASQVSQPSFNQMNTEENMSDTMTAVRNQVSGKLIERAQTDGDFRALLKSEPHKALQELLGIDPIPGFKINVIDEKPGEINIVLPAEIAQDELPDELLDLASGGTTFSSFLFFNDNNYKKPAK